MEHLVRTQGGNLNVRSGPGMNFGIIDRLRNGQRVNVRSRRPPWCEIGSSRWVHEDFVAPASGAGSAAGSGASGGTAAARPLDLVRREGSWLVFNREAFRAEVAQYFWGGALTPSPTELYARSGETRGRGGIELDLGDTHWALAQTAFAARPELMARMRPEARRRIDALPSQTPPVPRPDWVSADAWARFQHAPEGIHRYPRASRMQTDVILIKRDGVLWAGYAEGSTDEAFLRRQMGVIEPGFWRRVTLGDTTENARVRWLANANRGYNDFMWRQVSSGIGPAQALRNYREAVHLAYVAAFIPLIGGSFAAHPAGGPLMDAWRAR